MTFKTKTQVICKEILSQILPGKYIPRMMVANKYFMYKAIKRLG